MIRQTTLENGIRILTQTVAHVRSVAMGIWVNAGSRDEAPEDSGLTHLLEHMLFKGTKRRSAIALARAFDAMGGNSNAFTTTEATCYHAQVMDEHLPEMVDLLSDLFLNSTFDARELENERPVILQEIGMLEDCPEEFAHHLLETHAFPDHPVSRSILGSRETVEGFTRDDLVRFHETAYTADRILISLAGNLDHDSVVGLLSKAFERVPKGDENALPRTRPVLTPGVHAEVRAIEQSHLCIGTPGLELSHEHRFSAGILNTVLGGNMSSRLFQEIREKRGLAYSVYSFASSHIDCGMTGIYAGVSPDTLLPTAELIKREIDRLLVEKVSEDEISRAKAYTRGNLLLSMENTENLMVRLAQNAIHFGRQVPLEESLAAVAAVTPESVAKMAETLFGSREFVVSILGPETASLEALFS